MVATKATVSAMATASFSTEADIGSNVIYDAYVHIMNDIL